MIINSLGSNISVPVNTIYTTSLGNYNGYGIQNCVGVLGGSRIYLLPSGQYLIKGNTTNVILPSIFTASILNNIYQYWYQYYMYNDFGTASTYNAAYIDSQGNVYLGYYNGTVVIGLQFLSGSTTVNKIGLIGISVSASSTASVWYDKLDISFYAQLTNPTVTYTLATSNSGGTASGYIVLDGVASTTSNTTSTTPQTFTYQYSVTDTQINLHKISLWMVNSVGSDTTTMQFISLY